MRYRLGLDIGITSVGWSIIELDTEGNPYKIKDLGVRIFDIAENPKDGSSLALPRREARSARRRLRRKAYRLEQIKNLFIINGLIAQEELIELYKKNSDKSPWQLRYEALERKLTNEEIVRVLIHIAKRRGFKSNRKNGSESKTDEGKLLKGVIENKNIFKEKKYKTVGEMIFIDDKYKARKRNKYGDYSNTVSRDLLREEIKTIFEIQRAFGNKIMTKDLEGQYTNYFLAQRPYAKKDDIEKMIGYCTFEKNEKRCVKSAYTFERFMLFNKINTLKLNKNGETINLNEEQRKTIVELAHNEEKIKYTTIRKILNLDENIKFKGLSYGNKKTNIVEECLYISMSSYFKIKKATGEYFHILTRENLDTIGYALTVYKEDNEIREYLINRGIKNEIVEKVLKLSSFSKVGHLSKKAIDAILPFMEKGMDYDKACHEAGYDCFNCVPERSELLPKIPMELLTNPVVKRTLAQSRKVINAIIRKYGKPDTIHMELARDLSHNKKERDEILKKQNENRKNNESAISELFKINALREPTGLDIVKQKLWTSQNGRCMYSLKSITPEMLFDNNAVQVDHIIPYSRSFDDSYNNKVLVLSIENQNKGNKIPYEYFGHNIEKWHEFEEFVRSLNLPSKKIDNLLRIKLSRDDENSLKERNLVDTRYASRFLKNYIENNLEFADTGKKRKVYTVNGRITSFLRSRWGFNKDRKENDRHHALDATIVALADSSMVQKVTLYEKNKENKYIRKSENEIIDTITGEIMNKRAIEFPLPWNTFREELQIRLFNKEPLKRLNELKIESYKNVKFLDPFFVSRMPKRKITGPAHQETIRSGKIYDEKGYTIVRTPLSKIKLNKDNELDMYNKESDLLLYNALKKKLIEYNNNPEKAFKEPFYKPKSDGSDGNIVRSVKMIDKSNLLVDVNKGKANHGKMVRIDIFEKNKKYYIIPIYVSDFVKKELPNKAILAGKNFKDWVEIDDTYNFKFSLYVNDLVKIKTSNGIKAIDSNNNRIVFNNEVFAYYRTTHSGTGNINVIAHDNSWAAEGIGIKTAEVLEKYTVDLLGNYYLVKGEKRCGLEKCYHKQSK